MKRIIPMTAMLVPLNGTPLRFKIVAVDAAGRIRNRIINRSWSRSGAYEMRKRFQKSIDEGLIGASCVDCGKHSCVCEKIQPKVKKSGVKISTNIKKRANNGLTFNRI